MLENVAGDAAHNSYMAMSMLGVAHRLHHFVSPVDQAFDLDVCFDVLQRDGLGSFDHWLRLH
jgi:hypothetical protein